MRRSRSRLAIGAVLVALASIAALDAACSSETPTKVPRLTLRYAPSPPVAGQPLRVTFEGTNVGLVELYQGTELVAEVVNPLPLDVPSDFSVFTAKNAEPPHAFVYDGDGKRYEIKGTPGATAPPRDPDASTRDSGVVVDSGADADAAPPEYGSSCPGIDTDNDAGTECGPFAVLTFLTLRNGRSSDVRIAETYYAAASSGSPASCVVRSPGILVKPGVSYNANVTDNQSVYITEADGGAPLRHLRIQPGTSGPCKILIE